MGKIANIINLGYRFSRDENEKILLPVNLVELQNCLSCIWDLIIEQNTLKDPISNEDYISIYNKGAAVYNKRTGRPDLLIINTNTMATAKKAAAKKAAPKKAAIKKGAVKKVVTKKDAPKAKPAEPSEKKLTQKEQIIALSDKGKTIDEIVELTGIQKPNVAYYFSKLKLHPKKAKV